MARRVTPHREATSLTRCNPLPPTLVGSTVTSLGTTSLASVNSDAQDVVEELGVQHALATPMDDGVRDQFACQQEGITDELGCSIHRRSAA